MVGPLHGLPIAVKDPRGDTRIGGRRWVRPSLLINTRSDAIMVARMRRGRRNHHRQTNTPELGLGSHTLQSALGATRNAFDTDAQRGRLERGAAGGAGLRCLPVADAAISADSLRNPAAWTTSWLSALTGACASNPVPDASCRSLRGRSDGAHVEDLALCFRQAGWNAQAPLSLPSPGYPLRGSSHEAAVPARIAWLGDFGGILPWKTASSTLRSVSIASPASADG